MLKFLKALPLLAVLLLAPLVAKAQNALPTSCNPIITYQATPTALQWQACLTAINNNVSTNTGTITAAQIIAALTYTPLNKAGDTMTGKLNLPASSASAASLNIGAGGSSPSVPANGDLWMNATSAYLEYGGTAHDLLGTVSSASGDCTGTVSGGILPLTCAGLGHLASANSWSAANTFGQVVVNYVTYSTATTLTQAANAVCGDVSTAAVTITMPPGIGATIPNGDVIEVKDCKRNAATHNLTIAANTGQTIEGAGSQVISTAGGALDMIWNSATNNWDLF